MFIEARLVTAVRPNAVVIPEDAIVPAEGTNAAWVVVDGKADRRKVSLGVRTPGFVEVNRRREGGGAGGDGRPGDARARRAGHPRVVERKPPTAAQR